MIPFLQGLLLVAVVAASACVVVRWLVPILLRAVVDVLEDIVAVTAGVLLLPEYWLSTALRAWGGCPPQVAYEFSAAIASVAHHLQRILRRLCLGLARAATAVQPALVATVAGGLTGIGLLT